MNKEILKVLEDLYGIRDYIERKRGSTVQRRRLNRAIRTIQKIALEQEGQKQYPSHTSWLRRIAPVVFTVLKYIGSVCGVITAWVFNE